jgi:hypothetical protein
MWVFPYTKFAYFCYSWFVYCFFLSRYIYLIFLCLGLSVSQFRENCLHHQRQGKIFFFPIFRIETLLNIAIMSYLRPFSLQPKDLRLSALDCWLQHVFRLMRDSQVLAMRVPPRSPSFNDQYLDFQVTSFIIKSSSWIVQIHFYGDLHRINLLRYD